MDRLDNDLDIEDLMDLTDSEESSDDDHDKGLFDVHQPYVLELHELKKDDVSPGNTVQVPKVRKQKKKKKEQEEGSQSSDSDTVSENSVRMRPAKEEFYDAHDSYHAMPANQPPIVGALQIQEQIDPGLTPKLAIESIPDSPLIIRSATTEMATGQPPVVHKEPSAITKPVSRPE